MVRADTQYWLARGRRPRFAHAFGGAQLFRGVAVGGCARGYVGGRAGAGSGVRVGIVAVVFVAGDDFVGWSVCGDLSVFENDDPVGICDRGEAV